MLNYVIIGYGSRGEIYDTEFMKSGSARLVAVCETREGRIDVCKRLHKGEEIAYYTDEEEFFAEKKDAALCVVATLDAAHVHHALKALSLGYDLLLEKPIACTQEDCERIYEAAKANGRRVFVCHVLRYAPFFYAIKQALDTGVYGKVVNINLTENVAWVNYSHSYVRGNWHDTKETSPTIIAKCCHDLDILNWLIGEEADSVSSIGCASYFAPKNAPQGAGKDCYHCSAAADCIYNCEKFYWERYAAKGNYSWPVNVVYFGEERSHERVTEALKNSRYSQCVFTAEHDTVDHQLVNLSYKSGVTAHLTMTAFSDEDGREIHVHCEKGDIYGNMRENVLHMNVFSTHSTERKLVDLSKDSGLALGMLGHGGGDQKMIRGIVDYYEKGDENAVRTTLAQSMSSHMIGFAAERSRLNGGAVEKVKRLD